MFGRSLVKLAKPARNCESQWFATGSGYKGDDTCPVMRIFVADEEFFQRFLRESSRFEQSCVNTCIVSIQ